MTAASRIGRWTGNDDWRRRPDGTNGPGTRAVRLASQAVAAASNRLRQDLQRRRIAAVIVATLGTMGLTGLIAMAAGHGTGDLAWLSVFALLAVIPVCDALHRATFGRPGGLDSMAALERARTIETHASNLTRLCGDVDHETFISSMRDDLIERILSQVEQSAAALADREKRRTGGPYAPSRAHPRFRPADDRIVVCAADGMTTIARLIDVSLSGASVAGVRHAKVGEKVRVGSRKATVVRTLEEGFACAFDEPLEGLVV